MDEVYSVKEAYHLLIEGDEGKEECTWAADVWNSLVPSKMSTIAWRLFHKRLPTKENLRKRGVPLNSSALCVGGCGNPEMEDHLFFNCPTLGAIWRGIARWLGIPIVFAEGGPDHLLNLKNLVPGNDKIRDRMGVIWFVVVSLIWKVRNELIFNHTTLIWKNCWKRAKSFLGESLERVLRGSHMI
ncbi:hypothetical protein TSUD_241690 [Trifolium subterraneum]|uniref:Reverse transcriptase zinc-binding domain-containing protein n=1 Tax=Trifolium subterraneum TaxID=3900 RepID=A0A2Z6PSX5_TRISU|nr:hypothetical protein TSUD_241690 [Trifolium subterraneum]